MSRQATRARRLLPPSPLAHAGVTICVAGGVARRHAMVCALPARTRFGDEVSVAIRAREEPGPFACRG